jgi:DNA-binding protein YbaB
MNPQSLLDFLHTIPAFIDKAPPVVGVAAHGRVQATMQLDRQLTNISIHKSLLSSPLDLRRHLLSAIDDAQTQRNIQVQNTIIKHSYIAHLSLWDVEGTLLSIQKEQSVISPSFLGFGRTDLVSIVRNRQGEIERVVLNSVHLRDRKKLERAILTAAREGYAKLQRLQKKMPYPDLVFCRW